jgi:hypothetical protein
MPRMVDVRALRGSREVLAYQDGGLFPVLASAGDAIVAVVRGGAGHVGLDGRVETMRSVDGGATWSPPAVVADSAQDDRNPALGGAPGGSLVLAYQRMACYDADGVYWPQLRRADGSQPVDIVVTRSVDGGLTWEQPSPLGVSELADGSPYGKIVSADGALLLAVYARERASGATHSHVVRSFDDGRTWGEPTLIARGMNETALCPLRGGALLAVMRGADDDQAMFAARSSDGGRTWSAPEQIAPPRCHPADLVELATGDVLLTYGARRPPYRIEGMMSRDGAGWRDCLLLFSGPLHGHGRAERRTDLGYPSTAIDRGRGVTMYYQHPGDPGEPAERRPPYLATGYRAIAVTWDEETLMAAVDPVAG